MNVLTLEGAVSLCKIIKDICPLYGMHVALTGGVLYKDGPRKDLDLLFYPIIDPNEIYDVDGLLNHLAKLGISSEKPNEEYPDQFVVKAWYKQQRIDLLFP